MARPRRTRTEAGPPDSNPGATADALRAAMRLCFVFQRRDFDFRGGSAAGGL